MPGSAIVTGALHNGPMDKPGTGASPAVPFAIALFAGVLPLLGVNLAYLIAAGDGQIPSCCVYLHGCTSVSATGRQAPASFVFRGAMLPSSVLMFAYWYLAARWLCLHGDRSRQARALPWMGFVAMCFLVVYTNVLGAIGEWYAIYRRIGVVGYFSMTFFGQLLLTRRIERLAALGTLRLPAWILRTKVAVCAAMLLIGLISIPASVFLADSTTTERILEWNFSLLLALFFPLTAFAWRADRFAVGFHRREAG